jgi:hypothetical protein
MLPDEIIDELRKMIRTIGPVGALPVDGTISIPISPEAYHWFVFLGPWPDMPPALDLWRLDAGANLAPWD